MVGLILRYINVSVRCLQGKVVIAIIIIIIMCIIRPSTLLAIRIAAKHDDGTVVIVCLARMLLFTPKLIFRYAICYAQFNCLTFGRNFSGCRIELIYIFVSILHFNFVTWVYFFSLYGRWYIYVACMHVYYVRLPSRLPYLIFFDWCHNSNSILTLGF